MKDIDDGREAKKILDSPAWNRVNEAFDAWCLVELANNAGNPEECQKIALMQVARKHYFVTLTSIMNDGILAEAENE